MHPKYTPEVIDKLPENSVFVFGSNESGIHGAGAAKTAKFKFGAKFGLGFGPSGLSFAIPTKDWDIETLPIKVIETYVKRFIAYAKNRPETTFYVTKIGCGLAGHSIRKIAPLFKEVVEESIKNIILPEEFHHE